MAIGREPEPVEDRWLERTESKAVSAEARIDGDHSKGFMVDCCISLTGIFSIWAQEEMYGRGDDIELTALKAEDAKAAEV